MNTHITHNPIKIFIVGDHPVTIAGLEAIFAQTEDVLVVGQTPSGPDVFKLINGHHPDVVVVDAYLCAYEAEMLARELEQRGVDTKPLVLVPLIDESHLQQLLSAGVHGYLLKTEPIETILEAVQAIHRGERRVSSGS
jgi:DNA-binding NarL/FixJ family response regulator